MTRLDQRRYGLRLPAPLGCKILWLLSLVAATLSSQPHRTRKYLQSFLDSCPQSDPAYAIIRRDFQIPRNRMPVNDIACKEPYTKLPVPQVTDALITIQALRFAYRMDIGRSNYLPWTPLRLYDWFKSRVRGFNIDTNSNASVAASCCVLVSQGRYITMGPEPDALNRRFRQTPEGLLALIALIAHETRHTDGFRHLSCCGHPDACDQSYDEKNLSPFGIQYYLAREWLNRGVTLGYSCDPKTRMKSAMVFLQLANAAMSHFCGIGPLA